MRSVGRAFGIGAREMHVHALTKVAGAVAAAMAVGVSGCGTKTTAASPDPTAVTRDVASFCAVHAANDAASWSKYGPQTTDANGAPLSAESYGLANSGHADTAGMNAELLAGLEREQPAAPPEIADTVTALIAELGLVRQLNATYTTDLEAIQAQLLPTLAAAPQASDRYEAYVRDNCGGQ